MSDRDDRNPRIVRTRCISHIIHLLYRWAKETLRYPESEGFDNVQLARSIISWWESELSENGPCRTRTIHPRGHTTFRGS